MLILQPLNGIVGASAAPQHRAFVLRTALRCRPHGLQSHDAEGVKGRLETLAGGRPEIGGDPSVTDATQTNQTKQTQFTSTDPSNLSGSALST